LNPDCKALLEKARDSLAAARLLAEEGFTDISVSRSYYAMFYLAEALLLKEGLNFSKHSAVIAAFSKELVKSGRVPAEFHRYLIDAADDRKVGDYGYKSNLSEEDAASHLENAGKFMVLAEQLLMSSDDMT
jgi:uncharacterized protein (UPF0332 family)